MLRVLFLRSALAFWLLTVLLNPHFRIEPFADGGGPATGGSGVPFELLVQGFVIAVIVGLVNVLALRLEPPRVAAVTGQMLWRILILFVANALTIAVVAGISGLLGIGLRVDGFGWGLLATVLLTVLVWFAVPQIIVRNPSFGFRLLQAVPNTLFGILTAAFAVWLTTVLNGGLAVEPFGPDGADAGVTIEFVATSLLIAIVFAVGNHLVLSGTGLARRRMSQYGFVGLPVSIILNAVLLLIVMGLSSLIGFGFRSEAMGTTLLSAPLLLGIIFWAIGFFVWRSRYAVRAADS